MLLRYCSRVKAVARAILLFGLPSLAVAQTLPADVTAPVSSASPFEWRISAGSNAAFAFGSGATRLKQSFTDLAAQNDSVVAFEGKLLPRYGGYIGVEATYLFRPKWRVGAGLRFSQKGYVQEENTTFRHPYYQYDQVSHNRFSYRVNTIELPVQFYWLTNERLRLHTGFSLGGPFDAVKQQVVYQHSSRVFINGVEDSSQSTAEQTEEQSLAGHVRLFHLGYLLGASYRVLPHWWVQANGQATTTLYQQPWDVYNVVAQLGVVWQY